MVVGRRVIEIGAGYSFATKGEGSTFRIWAPDGDALIVLPEMYHSHYEKMADALAEDRAKLVREIEELREDVHKREVAIKLARDTFQRYGDLHAAKPDDHKATANYLLAAKMEEALTERAR